MQKSAQRTVEAQAIHLTTLMCLCFINAFFFFLIKRLHKLKERAVSHFGRGAWHALKSLKNDIDAN